jgi:hypothetical protein
MDRRFLEIVGTSQRLTQCGVKSPPDMCIDLRCVYNLNSRALRASKHQQRWLLGLFHFALFLQGQKINYVEQSSMVKEI